MAERFVIRDSRKRDFEALWRIDQACFTPGVAYSRAELAHYMRGRTAFTLVAETGVAASGRIVGFLVAERRRDAGHIVTIDILPVARRRGLGAQLMSRAEERLREDGCSQVTLETAVDNRAAIGFYHRLGYAVTGTIPRYYHGEVDALVMSKEIG